MQCITQAIWPWRSEAGVARGCMQVLITVLHLGNYGSGDELLPIAVAVQCILLWVRLQFFSRLFRNTQFDFVDSMTVRAPVPRRHE